MGSGARGAAVVAVGRRPDPADRPRRDGAAGEVALDRVTGDARTFTYDAGQRITQIIRGDTKVDLTYGPVGRMKTEVQGRRDVARPAGL